MVFCICIIVWSWISFATSECGHLNSAKIGIIGGGATGLYFATRLIEEYGNDINSKNIYIFEKDSLPCHSTQSFEISDGYFKDIGAVYVPRATFNILDSNLTLDYQGESLLFDLLYKYNISLTQRSFNAVNETNDGFDIINGFSFLFNKGYSIDSIINEIIGLLLYFKRIKLLKYQLYNNEEALTFDDYIENGLTLKGESLEQWSIRLNLPIAAHLVGWMTDIAAAATPPSFVSNDNQVTHSAYTIFSYGEYFFIPFCQKILLFLGINKDTNDLIRNDKFLYNIMSDPYILYQSYYIVTNGFQTLWNSMSDELINDYSVNIYYNTLVTSIETIINTNVNAQGYTNDNNNNNDKILVRYNDNDEMEFDFVFIATPTDDALEYLNEFDFYQLYNIFLYQTNQDPYVYALTFNLTQNMIDNSYFGGIPYGPYAYYPNVNYGGTVNFLPFTKNCSIIYFALYEEAPVITIWGLADNSIDTLGIYPFEANYQRFENITNIKKEILNICLNQNANYLKNKLGLTDLTIDDNLAGYIWPVPTDLHNIGEKNNFREILNDLQGNNNVFVISEVVSGYTIPQLFSTIESDLQTYYKMMKKQY